MTTRPPSNLIATRLRRLSAIAQQNGSADRAARLALAATISAQTSIAYTSDHDEDHDRAVAVICDAVGQFTAGVRVDALPAALRTAIADAVDALGMGDGSHCIAAAQILILAALGMLEAEAAATADPLADRTIDGLRRLTGGTAAPGWNEDLDAWQRRRRQAEGLDP